MSLISDISLSWLYYSLSAVYAATIISIVIVVLSENRNPVKSLAWVAILLLLPALGLVLYLFFGRSIKNKRLISRRNRRKLRRSDEQSRKVRVTKLGLSVDSQRLIQLTRTLSGEPCYTGNHVKIYTRGRDKIEDLMRDIAGAKKYVHIQYYIIENDTVGRRLQQLLIDKAAEGVKVRVIYDNVGSIDYGSSFFRSLRKAGVEAHPFFKVVFPLFGTRINWRNHRKICVIDGEVGYIGGMNIADRYVDGGKHKAWRDTHLRVTGPIVAALNFSFAVDWNFMSGELIALDYPEIPVVAEGDVMQMLTSGPTSQNSPLATLFIKAIASAKQRVFIQTPYFLPTEALLRALQSAALAGCDVRVMIPRKSDSWMLNMASASYITECLRSGMKIYFYEAGMLHSKTLLVDDEFVSVGSTNFDFRSFEHNFEANLQIYSKKVNERMRDIFYDDLKHCTRVMLPEWRKRPFVKKALESVTRLFSPIL